MDDANWRKAHTNPTFLFSLYLSFINLFSLPLFHRLFFSLSFSLKNCFVFFVIFVTFPHISTLRKSNVNRLLQQKIKSCVVDSFMTISIVWIENTFVFQWPESTWLIWANSCCPSQKYVRRLKGNWSTESLF